MKTTLSRHIWLLLATVAVSLPSTRALAGVEDEINQIEDRRYEFMVAGDATELAQILADEFVYNQLTGKVVDKAGYLVQMQSGEVKILTFQRYGVRIHAYGDTATAMGSTRLDLIRKGEPQKVDLYYLNVWVKRDGRWQLAARQSALKPAPK